jgi:hypothetical protein
MRKEARAQREEREQNREDDEDDEDDGEDLGEEEEEETMSQEDFETLKKNINAEFVKKDNAEVDNATPMEDRISSLGIRKGPPTVSDFPDVVPMKITISFLTPEVLHSLTKSHLDKFFFFVDSFSFKKETPKGQWNLECTAGPFDAEPPHGFFIDNFSVSLGDPTEDTYQVDFQNLPPELQERIYKYLESEWRVNDAFAAYLKQWVLERRAKEEIDFLQTMKKLLKGT